MNTDIIKGKWTEIKGEIQSAWGKLTHDELDQTKGNMTSIAGLIRQHYGEAKDDVSGKLDQIVQRFEKSTADKSEDAKEKLKDEKHV